MVILFSIALLILNIIINKIFVSTFYFIFSKILYKIPSLAMLISCIGTLAIDLYIFSHVNILSVKIAEVICIILIIKHFFNIYMHSIQETNDLLKDSFKNQLTGFKKIIVAKIIDFFIYSLILVCITFAIKKIIP